MKYNRWMEKIEVTPEMRERVLRGVSEAQEEVRERKGSRWVRWLPYAAACLLLLVAGGTLLQEARDSEQPSPLQSAQGIVAYDSLEELSQALGFQVKEIHTLPFDPEQITYLSYWGQMAEIRCSAAEHSLLFRMSVGEEDISGNYNTYPDVIRYADDGRTIVLKGNDGAYSLAIWSEDGYSYSLETTSGVTKVELLDIAQSVE